MPQARDIKARIRGIKNIQQITRAMKMVSTAKLRRAQDSMANARPYTERIGDLARNLVRRTGTEGMPLLEQRLPARVLLIVITGDKGLCGAFNNNINRTAEGRIKSEPERETTLYVVGRKANEYFKKRSYRVAGRTVDVFRHLQYGTAEEIADTAMGWFLDGTVDRVYLVYNRFRSKISQEITVQPLLPVGGKDGGGGEMSGGQTGADAGPGVEYLFEPSREELLRDLLPHVVRTNVWQALLESAAAEHAARMSAMENATTNAEEMMEHLTLVMNKVRQANITRELIEVVSSAEALR